MAALNRRVRRPGPPPDSEDVAQGEHEKDPAGKRLQGLVFHGLCGRENAPGLVGDLFLRGDLIGHAEDSYGRFEFLQRRAGSAVWRGQDLDSGHRVVHCLHFLNFVLYNTISLDLRESREKRFNLVGYL